MYLELIPQTAIESIDHIINENIFNGPGLLVQRVMRDLEIKEISSDDDITKIITSIYLKTQGDRLGADHFLKSLAITMTHKFYKLITPEILENIFKKLDTIKKTIREEPQYKPLPTKISTRIPKQKKPLSLFLTFFGIALGTFFLLQLGHINHTFSLISHESAKTLLEFSGISLFFASIFTAVSAKRKVPNNLKNKEQSLPGTINEEGYLEL